MVDKAVVVLSGGQDSTTALWWALDQYGSDNVTALTFDYGQRHRIEIECAAEIAGRAGVPQTVLPIDTFAALGGNALTDSEIDVDSADKVELPATFVPGRNLIFLTYAAAWAWPRKIQHLVTGVAQTDYSGYPDCRRNTIDALSNALSLGMDLEFTIHTPLMDLSKKDTVLLAQRLGALDVMAMTHTCYAGRRPPCGQCQACKLRSKGFAEAGIPDPLLSR
jgi:7-cyano-7-deazaguanine synthase